MKRLIQWSIEHHWMVLGFSVLLLAAGLWTARDMPVDVFPDLTAPTVTILTEGHGMAPDEMESLVTFPIESAINGASSVRRVRSATAVGIECRTAKLPVPIDQDFDAELAIIPELARECPAGLVNGPERFALPRGRRATGVCGWGRRRADR
jgi:hypothetical protein